MEKNEKILKEIKRLEDSLINRLKSEKRLIKIPPRRDKTVGTIEEQAILLLSDIHCGKINMFPNIDTGKSHETYNYNVSKKEMVRLITSINRVNSLLGTHYNLKKLNIFCLGDLLDNDRIIAGHKFYIEEGIGWQLETASKMISEMIIELLKHFEQIEITFVGGNHGRTNKRMEKEPYYNNYDHLLGKILQILFGDEKRVIIDCPQAWFAYKKIYKWKYFLHHGNDIWTWMSYPYYGITRKSAYRKAELPFDVECIGHFHTRMEIPIGKNSMTLVNGSWINDDDYSWFQFGKLTQAEQIYFGVSKKRPKTWQFNLDLTPKR